MSEQESIRRALEGLHASEHTLEEVLNMTYQKKHNGRMWRTGRRLAIAAAFMVVCVTTALAADYALNHREIFFFDTVEALMAAQRTGEPSQAGSYTVPGSAEENRDMETVSEGVARWMESGYYGEETLLSDETESAPGTMWERRRVTESWDEDYGRIINEYLSGEAYAGNLIVEGLLDWELASVTETMTPDTDGQIVLVSRDADNQRLVMAKALLGYTTGEGKRFQIEYRYDADSRYLQEKEYILSEAYDDCYVYTTGDQAEVLIEVYDGQIWAGAVNVETGNAVNLYTTGCTKAEMETILDGLQLAAVLCAGS